MPAARRYPPPWTIEEHNNACFIGKDATGQALGYFYLPVTAAGLDPLRVWMLARQRRSGKTRREFGVGHRAHPGQSAVTPEDVASALDVLASRVRRDRGSATQARGGRELGTLRALLHRVPGVSRYEPLTGGLWLLLNTALFAQRAVRIDATLNRMIAGTAREYLAFVIAAAVGARAPPDYPHTFAAMLTDWIANPLLI
jgi:hypothetical protein